MILNLPGKCCNEPSVKILPISALDETDLEELLNGIDAVFFERSPDIKPIKKIPHFTGGFSNQ